MIYILLLVVIAMVVVAAFWVSGDEGKTYSGNRHWKSKINDNFNSFTL